MKIDRRNFIRAIGATGVSLALGEQISAAEKNEESTDTCAILYDSTRCVGCQSCEYACAEANNLPEPSESIEADILRLTNENRRTVVNAFNTTEGEITIKHQCMHCLEPSCVSACLTQAMYKTPEGPVIWRADKCMGCRYCMISCPFDAPKFEFHSPNPKIVKCDMCYQRTQQGLLPACVENCPAEAILYGKRSELLREARKRIVESPELYNDYIYGEKEAGGTGFLYLASVPFEELGFRTNIQKSSYPALSKSFLYSVPFVFVLWPTLLLGLYEATKNNHSKNVDEDE